MARSLSAEHKRALAEGRKRAAKQAEKEAVARVRAYQKWLASPDARGKMRSIPAIPSNADYQVARRAGVVK